jgi:hypothetical protein
MDKRLILQQSNFGERVAEDESSEIEKYFVETDHWSRAYWGEVDVIYGPKGSGKSALYSLLMKRTDQLFDKGIMIVSAEKPRGTPVFKDLQHPPNIWSWVYWFVETILSNAYKFCLKGIRGGSKSAIKIDRYLTNAGLSEPSRNLAQMLKGVFDYVRSYFRPPETIEGNMIIDPVNCNM